MKKDIKDSFKKYGTLLDSNKLISIEELKASVEKESTIYKPNNFMFSNYRRLIKMTIISASILSVCSILFNYYYSSELLVGEHLQNKIQIEDRANADFANNNRQDNNNDKKPYVSSAKKADLPNNSDNKNINENKPGDDKIAVSTAKKVEFSNISDKKINNGAEPGKAELLRKIMIVERKVYNDNGDEKSISNGKKTTAVKITQKPDTCQIKQKPRPGIDINGINMLELTIDEFEKIVPNFKLNDTTFLFWTEEILHDKEFFKSLRFDTLGYKLSEMPIVLKKCAVDHNDDNWWGFYFSEHFKSNERYSKTLYVAYHKIINNELRITSFSKSPLLKEKGGLYTELYNIEANWSMKIYELNKAGKKDSIDKFFENMRFEENKLLSKLIPVHIKYMENKEAIFWFIPNEEFLKSLPERYSQMVRNELFINDNIENHEVPPELACKGFPNAESIYDICRLSSGSVKILDIFPNPAKEFTTCKFLLTEPRVLKITLHDIEGKLIKEYKNTSYPAGENEYKLDLTSLKKGFYMLALTTDKGEQVVKRFILY